MAKAELDAELVALNTCAKHLSYLDDKAIKRVLGYLADKFEIDREEICLINEPLNFLFDEDFKKQLYNGFFKPISES